jgi:hypothetical protein
VPDGTETQEMCPREIPLFPVFQRFPKYVYGFRNMFTVSEMYLRFPKYITYPGVVVPREYSTTPLGVLLGPWIASP